jgi:hypothetical protein
MKRLSWIVLAAVAAPLSAQANPCVPQQTEVIHADAHCVDGGGINIGFNGEEGIKVACLRDRQVQGICGADGSLTRLRAYNAWYKKLKQFEADCLTSGGTFAYQDPTFREPENESFCLQAQPEVGTGMFEEPLCNFRSVCPAVTVTCEVPCDKKTPRSSDQSSGAHVTLRNPPQGDKTPLF